MTSIMLHLFDKQAFFILPQLAARTLKSPVFTGLFLCKEVLKA